MADPYTALCKYCGQQFTEQPRKHIQRLQYCPVHRDQYYSNRVTAGNTPINGYQDTRPGKGYAVPRAGETARRMSGGWDAAHRRLRQLS